MTPSVAFAKTPIAIAIGPFWAMLAWLAKDGRRGVRAETTGSNNDHGYFLQVRYPGRAWTTMRLAATRRDAALGAGEACRVPDVTGRGASQVRVISRADLEREGGPSAVQRAVDELAATEEGE